MANLKHVVSTYQNLTQEWNKKPPNLDKCGELLAKLKASILMGNIKLRFKSQ